MAVKRLNWQKIGLNVLKVVGSKAVGNKEVKLAAGRSGAVLFSCPHALGSKSVGSKAVDSMAVCSKFV